MSDSAYQKLRKEVRELHTEAVQHHNASLAYRLEGILDSNPIEVTEPEPVTRYEGSRLTDANAPKQAERLTYVGADPNAPPVK